MKIGYNFPNYKNLGKNFPKLPKLGINFIKILKLERIVQNYNIILKNYLKFENIFAKVL